ncbi:protein tyrosine phosphatase family protein [Altericista sp. CCNU0014]|uniref:protein tyrosine phosphatase family protein n=1 Tax=Altericista sp. CCNU0014 TaxID=3082949 RepID=UPI00384F4308
MSATDPLTELYHYRRISPEIATSGQPTEEQFQRIAAQGIQAVINLGLTDADYALPDEQGLVQSMGLSYLHIPVQWEHPTLKNFQDFLAAMRRYNDRSLLVHCAANFRVSCFMALYHVFEDGWIPEQAMADLKAVWSPNQVWQNFIATVLERGIE